MTELPLPYTAKRYLYRHCVQKATIDNISKISVDWCSSSPLMIEQGSSFQYINLSLDIEQILQNRRRSTTWRSNVSSIISTPIHTVYHLQTKDLEHHILANMRHKV